MQEIAKDAMICFFLLFTKTYISRQMLPFFNIFHKFAVHNFVRCQIEKLARNRDKKTYPTIKPGNNN